MHAMQNSVRARNYVEYAIIIDSYYWFLHRAALSDLTDLTGVASALENVFNYQGGQNDQSITLYGNFRAIFNKIH